MHDLAPIAGLSGAGGLLILFVLWLKRRLESGHITIRIGSRSGEQLELDREQLRLQLAARDAKIEVLEAAVEKARALEEHWQRQYIEHLSRKA